MAAAREVERCNFVAAINALQLLQAGACALHVPLKPRHKSKIIAKKAKSGNNHDNKRALNAHLKKSGSFRCLSKMSHSFTARTWLDIQHGRHMGLRGE